MHPRGHILAVIRSTGSPAPNHTSGHVSTTVRKTTVTTTTLSTSLTLSVDQLRPTSSGAISEHPSSVFKAISTHLFLSLISQDRVVETNIPLVSPKEDTTLSYVSSTQPPTVTSVGRHHSESSKKWVLPLALALTIVFLCLCLLALRARRRKMHRRILPGLGEDLELEGLNASGDRGMLRQNDRLTAFDILSSTTTAAFASAHSRNSILQHREPSNVISTTASGARRSKRSLARKIITPLRKKKFNPASVRTEPFRISLPFPSLPNRGAETVGVDATLRKGASSDNGHAQNVSLVQPSREEVEDLRERLRILENIALSLSGHATVTRADSVRGVEPELIVVPPPEYDTIIPSRNLHI